jgi:tripartite-type tricarboxylate transporter receptor subunit TctC
LIGQWLSERLGQPFIIENRPGAGSNLATEAVVRASADGYTLLMVNTANAWNTSLYDKLNFNFIQDIAPIAGVARGPSVVVVNPLFPAKTLPEFLAYAKANPGKINMGAVGPGSAAHMFGELFKMMAGVNLVTVHYRNPASAVSDLIGGQVQVSFDPLALAVEHIRAGELRVLAVTSAARLEMMPSIPTVGDLVPGYEASSWYGVGASKNTPMEFVDKLNEEVNAGLANPKLNARIADLGYTVFAGSPVEFGNLIADETEKWAKVVKFANIKAE